MIKSQHNFLAGLITLCHQKSTANLNLFINFNCCRRRDNNETFKIILNPIKQYYFFYNYQNFRSMIN